MMYFEHGAADAELNDREIRQGLLEALKRIGPRDRVLAIPPDMTRYHSMAGRITAMVWEHYGDKLRDVLPALGTHAAMTAGEIRKMYGPVPHTLFRVHDWRSDLLSLGEVPASFVEKVSEGKVSYSWPAEVNRILVEGGHDLILSVGQVVPHEVVGMANHNKNIFVGTGGQEGINKSHFLGAAYGMERIMGRKSTPVREVLNYATKHFGSVLPVVYVLTVVGRNRDGALVMRGLFIGDDEECYQKAADLSLEVNFQMLDQPLAKVLVYLDPEEYKSTWLGNKSIYRTRMALADGGELVVMAPGLREFGEDREIDRLIRKYGYQGTGHILEAVKEHPELQENLSAAAHLIHGSADGRFSVCYCPGHLSRKEIESVNYDFADLDEMLGRYDPAVLKDGFNTMPDGELVYYISNPALGLWSWKGKFKTGAED